MNYLRISFILIFCCFSFINFAQDDNSQKIYLDTIFSLAQSNSVMRDSVDWEKIKTEYYRLGKEATTAEELIPSAKFLLKSLGDFHGRLWVNKIPHNGIIKKRVPSDFEIPEALFRDYQYGALPIEGKVLKNQIGYLQVPGIMMSQNDSKNAEKIRSIICELQQKNQLKGWVIDLRMNGGGTMFPMLAGLSPFLGNDTLGYFMDYSGEYEDPWIMKNGELFIGTYQSTNYNITMEGCENLNLEKAQVAVLISAATSSSGEVTTLAFRNRNNTILIGENTSGYTTGVSWIPLSDDMVIQIANSFYADRNKNIFCGTSILPDIHIQGGQNLEDLEKDKMVLEAIEWINRQK